jgi:hypothetical protein
MAKQSGDLHRDSSPREWGLGRGTPTTARGVMQGSSLKTKHEPTPRTHKHAHYIQHCQVTDRTITNAQNRQTRPPQATLPKQTLEEADFLHFVWPPSKEFFNVQNDTLGHS